MHYFFDAFFHDGWLFFYKFSLTFLATMSSKILMVDEDEDIKDFIKQPLQGRKF
jgi:hypothetical protein